MIRDDTEAAFARVSRDAAVIRETVARALAPYFPKGSCLKIGNVIVQNGVVNADAIVVELRGFSK